MFGGYYFGMPYFAGAPSYIIGITPEIFYPFVCDQDSVVIDKEGTCITQVIDLLNTSNKKIYNSLKNCP